MAWWCVKLLNWRHVRHTLFSGVCRGNMQDIFWSAFARAERWGTPVIWAPKKDVSQGCAFDSKTFMISMISDPKLPASSGWKSCVGLLAVWLKSSFNISEQNRRYPTGNCCWQSWPCYFLWRSPLISWQYEETRFKSRVIIDHCHSPAQEVTNAFVTSALTFRKAFSQGISLLTNVREFAHDGRTARHSNAEYDARYCAVSCLL